MLHVALLLAGLLVNARDWKMLVLTTVVAASVFTPVTHSSYEGFYVTCIMSETLVATVAWVLRANASSAIIFLCAMLIASHVLGYYMDGSPLLSPYRILVQIFEHAEMAACILLSNPIIGKLRNK